MANNALKAQEGAFLVKAMRHFNVPAVEVERRGQGDICVFLGPTPRIRVGDRWAAANPEERRKRLLHELLHVVGLRHDRRARRMGYYSNPERDELSRRVYRALKRNLALEVEHG